MSMPMSRLIMFNVIFSFHCKKNILGRVVKVGTYIKLSSTPAILQVESIVAHSTLKIEKNLPHM
jgi:hypothetical protein